MRPITFEEREDLCRRADGQELLDFVAELQQLRRKYRISHQKLLAIFLRVPQATDISKAEVLAIRNKLAEEGHEFTPDQVVDTMEKALCKVRNWLRASGWAEDKIPSSDVELRKILRA